jgi:mono/diheme cytochrome c family protein
MLRILTLVCIAVVLGLTVYGVITVYDESLQVGRMWETPVVKPHEAPLAVMAASTMPFGGGEAMLRASDPDTMQAPFSLVDPDAIAQGKTVYGYYCVHCHGKYHDGNGTVGQSFAPLPGDLRSLKVQGLPAGRMFHEISYGIPGGRQPALASTMAVEERWQAVAYIRSLGTRP